MPGAGSPGTGGLRLDSVEKIDDLNVKFNLNDVYSLAHIQIGKQRIVPEHIWKDVADPVTFTNDHPVATGPFTEVTDFTDQDYKICRNPNFWMEGATLRGLPGNTRHSPATSFQPGDHQWRHRLGWQLHP